jgi:transposase-like protein
LAITRNLLGHAQKRMQDELTEDYRDMIYADTAAEVENRRKAFQRKWRLTVISSNPASITRSA